MEEVGLNLHDGRPVISTMLLGMGHSMNASANGGGLPNSMLWNRGDGRVHSSGVKQVNQKDGQMHHRGY